MDLSDEKPDNGSKENKRIDDEKLSAQNEKRPSNLGGTMEGKTVEEKIQRSRRRKLF